MTLGSEVEQDQHIEDVEDMLDRICGDMFLSKSCREIFGIFVAQLVEGERSRICVFDCVFRGSGFRICYGGLLSHCS